MSANDVLLVFLDPANEFEGWLLLRDGGVAARGAAVEDLPPLADPETGDALLVAAVVPGEAVSVHWLDVPAGLAPAQAAAAARLMASEVSAQPLADMHVAVGPDGEDRAMRAVALAPALAMAGWLGRLQGQGLDPDIVLPEPLLLAVPDKGLVRYVRGDNPLFRGATDAFTIEAELAETVTGGSEISEIDGAAFEAGLPEAVAALPVNLRQGAFAKKRRWAIEWPWVRRMALLAAAILLVTLTIQLAAILRYTYAADAAEAEAGRVAASALPGDVRTDRAAERLAQRLVDLRGGGVGYGAIASGVFGAVRATPNVELTTIRFDRDGSLLIVAQGDSPASLSALQQRIEASGFAVAPGTAQSGGGRPSMEMTVRAR